MEFFFFFLIRQCVDWTLSWPQQYCIVPTCIEKSKKRNNEPHSPSPQQTQWKAGDQKTWVQSLWCAIIKNLKGTFSNHLFCRVSLFHHLLQFLLFKTLYWLLIALSTVQCSFLPSGLLRYNWHIELYKFKHSDLTYTPYEMITTKTLVNIHYSIKIQYKRKSVPLWWERLEFTLLTTFTYNIKRC